MKQNGHKTQTFGCCQIHTSGDIYTEG